MTQPNQTEASAIRVKFLWKGSFTGRTEIFRRQLPAGETWGRCQFLFDPTETNYDWLAVYDDMPLLRGKRKLEHAEPLACAPQHTSLVTVEPSSIKTYGKDFLDQFGLIITSQETWAVVGAQTLRTQPALRWFYGDSCDQLQTFDCLCKRTMPEKHATLSTVCSDKQQSHTLHAKRYQFTWDLKRVLPELEIYGRGIRAVKDKAQALDGFRYHLAIENHVCEHHWTEKLSDAFLGWTLPFYFGCPNLTDYFPAESFIPIDIRDFDSAVSTIRDAIANNEFERRLPAIVAARQTVLERYNLFAVLAREIEQRFDAEAPTEPKAKILSRHSCRRQSVGHAIRFGWELLKTHSHNQLARRDKAA